MTIFPDTMKKSISIYYQMLHRYLPQTEQITKLTQLNLKNNLETLRKKLHFIVPVT